MIAVVPYIPILLLAMDSHINAQYVYSKGQAKYMTKYMLKKEPAGIFNIHEPSNSAEAYISHRRSPNVVPGSDGTPVGKTGYHYQHRLQVLYHRHAKFSYSCCASCL
jgi:hypothetical protein